MRRKMMTRLRAMRAQQDGAKVIEAEVVEAYDDLRHRQAKQEEFPDDEELVAEVEVQKTRVRAIEECFVDLIEEPEEVEDQAPVVVETKPAETNADSSTSEASAETSGETKTETSTSTETVAAEETEAEKTARLAKEKEAEDEKNARREKAAAMKAALKKVQAMAAEKEAYSEMYSEAKDMLVQGDVEEFGMYFESIRLAYTDLETRYKYAVQHKKRDEAALAAEFAKMLITYKAATECKFDLEEWKKEEDAEMTVDLPEAERIEIESTIKYLVQKRDKEGLTNTIRYSYDLMAKADTALKKQPDNEALTLEYQTAKEKYSLNKRYYSE